MGLNLEQKQAVVAEVSAEVALAQAIVVAEYRGLPVGNMTELRKRARNSGVYLRVLKNTLARRAVTDTPFAGLADQLVGPLAYGISADPVAVAKVLHEFSRENIDKFTIRGGAMPNVMMTPAQVAQLAKMPSRQGTAQYSRGNHAGADRETGAHPERGARQVRAHAGGRSGTKGKTGGLTAAWRIQLT